MPNPSSSSANTSSITVNRPNFQAVGDNVSTESSQIALQQSVVAITVQPGATVNVLGDKFNFTGDTSSKNKDTQQGIIQVSEHRLVEPPQKEKVLVKEFHDFMPHYSKEEIDQYYVKREFIHNKLDRYFNNKEILHLAAINGIGGAGKTRIATYYFYYSKKKYKHRYWIQADTSGSIEQQLRKLLHIFMDSKEINILKNEMIVSLIKEKLKEIKNWLIIFDGVGNSREIDNYNDLEGGDILITTRDRDQKENVYAISVDTMSPIESICLMKLYIKISQGDEKILEELVDKNLGNYPLALAQAGAFMKVNEVTIHEYVKLYNGIKNKLDLLDDNNLQELDAKEHESITVTMQMSVKKVQEDSEQAINILKIASIINEKNIPFEILQCYIIKNSGTELPFYTARKAIEKYSLMIFNRESNLAHIHNIVQIILKNLLFNSSREQLLCLEKLVDVFHGILKDKISMSHKVLYWNLLFDNYYEHLVALIENYKIYNEKLNNKVAMLFSIFGTCLLGKGELSNSIEYLKQAYDFYRIELNIDAGNLSKNFQQKKHSYESKINFFYLMNNYGLALHLSGEGDKAEKMLRQCISLKGLPSLEKTKDFWMVEENLAICLRARRQVKEAYEIIKKVYEYKKTYCPKALDFAETLDVYATTLYYANNPGESIKYYDEALSIIQEYYGDSEHPASIYIHAHKGNAHLCNGDTGIALKVHKNAVDIIRKLHIEKNIISIAVINAYANSLSVQKDYKKAINLYKEILAIADEINYMSYRTIEVRANLLCSIFLSNIEPKDNSTNIRLEVDRLKEQTSKVYQDDTNEGERILKGIVNELDQRLDCQILTQKIFEFTLTLFKLIAGEEHFFTTLAVERLTEIKNRLISEKMSSKENKFFPVSTRDSSTTPSPFNLNSNDFKVIVKNYYYVDKTKLIYELLTNKSIPKTILITRPRQFGKSLNLSMLYYFFSEHELQMDNIKEKKSYAKSKVDTEIKSDKAKLKINSSLFDNLEIKKDEYIKQFIKHFGQYKVIMLDFAGLAEASNYSQFICGLEQMMKKVYLEFSIFLPVLNDTETEVVRFNKFINGEIWRNKDSFLKISLQYLCEFIIKVNQALRCKRIKPIVLIDNYDAPIIRAKQMGFYNEHDFDNQSKIGNHAAGILGSFLKCLLTEEYCDRAILMAVCNVIEGNTSIFPLNTHCLLTVDDNRLCQHFGFTLENMQKILKEWQIKESQQSEFQRWYGYYYSADEQLFNPCSVIGHLVSQHRQFNTYWIDALINTFTITHVTKLIQNSGDKTKKILAKLINEGKVEDQTVKQKAVRYFMSSEQHKIEDSGMMLNLLYANGFLTIFPCVGKKCIFFIPNIESHTFFITRFSQILEIKFAEFIEPSILYSKINRQTVGKSELILQLEKTDIPEKYLILWYACGLLGAEGIQKNFLKTLVHPLQFNEWYKSFTEFLPVSTLAETKLNLHVEICESIKQHIKEKINNDYLKVCINKIIGKISEVLNCDDILKITNKAIINLRDYYPLAKKIIVFLDKDNLLDMFPNVYYLLVKLAKYELYINVDFVATHKFLEKFHDNSKVDNTLLMEVESLRARTHYRENKFEKAKDHYKNFAEYYRKISKKTTLQQSKNKDKIQQLGARNFARLADVYSMTAQSEKDHLEALENYSSAIQIYSNKNIEWYYYKMKIHQSKLHLGHEEINAKPLHSVFADMIDAFKNNFPNYYNNNAFIVAKLYILLAWSQILLQKDKTNKEAVANLRKAENIIIEIFGIDHFETAKLGFYKLLLFREYNNCDAIYEDAILKFAKYYKDEKKLCFLKLKLNYSRWKYERGDTIEAYNLCHDILTIQNQLFGNLLTKYLVQCYEVLAFSCLVIGNFSEAKYASNEFTKLIERNYPANKKYCIQMCIFESIFLTLEAEYIKAQKKLIEAKEYAMHEVISKSFPIYLQIVNCHLHFLSLLMGDYKEFFFLPNKSIFKKLLSSHNRGCDILEIAKVMYSYGRMYMQLGNSSAAKHFFDEATLNLKKYHLTNHPFYAMCLSELLRYTILDNDYKGCVAQIEKINDIYANHGWQTYPAYQQYKLNVCYVLYILEVGVSPLFESSFDKKLNPSKTIISTLDKIYKIFDIKNTVSLLYSVIDCYQLWFDYLPFDYIKACSLLGKLLFHQGNCIEAQQEFQFIVKCLFESKNILVPELKIEVYYYLKCIYKWFDCYALFHYADDMFKKNCISLHSKFVVEATEILEANKILGAIKLTTLDTYLLSDISIYQIDIIEDKLNFFIKKYEAFLLEENENCENKQKLLSILIATSLVANRQDKARDYLNIYRANCNNGQIMLDLTPLAAFIPTNIVDFLHQMKRVLKNIDNIEGSFIAQYRANLYHNLACLSHAHAHYDKNWCNDEKSYYALITKAEKYFKKSLNIALTSSTFCEYINFLFHQERFKDVISLYNEKKHIIDCNGIDIQTYTHNEKPALIKILSNLIDEHEIIKINQKLLLYYLLCHSFLKVDNQSGANAQLTALKEFFTTLRCASKIDEKIYKLLIDDLNLHCAQIDKTPKFQLLKTTAFDNQYRSKTPPFENMQNDAKKNEIYILSNIMLQNFNWEVIENNNDPKSLTVKLVKRDDLSQVLQTELMLNVKSILHAIIARVYNANIAYESPIIIKNDRLVIPINSPDKREFLNKYLYNILSRNNRGVYLKKKVLMTDVDETNYFQFIEKCYQSYFRLEHIEASAGHDYIILENEMTDFINEHCMRILHSDSHNSLLRIEAARCYMTVYKLTPQIIKILIELLKNLLKQSSVENSTKILHPNILAIIRLVSLITFHPRFGDGTKITDILANSINKPHKSYVFTLLINKMIEQFKDKFNPCIVGSLSSSSDSTLSQSPKNSPIRRTISSITLSTSRGSSDDIADESILRRTVSGTSLLPCQSNIDLADINYLVSEKKDKSDVSLQTVDTSQSTEINFLALPEKSQSNELESHLIVNICDATKPSTTKSNAKAISTLGINAVNNEETLWGYDGVTCKKDNSKNYFIIELSAFKLNRNNMLNYIQKLLEDDYVNAEEAKVFETYTEGKFASKYKKLLIKDKTITEALQDDIEKLFTSLNNNNNILNHIQ